MSCSPQLSPAAARAAARNCHSSETQQPDKQSASGLQPASVDGRIPDNRTSKSQNASWMYHDIYIYTSVTTVVDGILHTYTYNIYIYMWLCGCACVFAFLQVKLVLPSTVCTRFSSRNWLQQVCSFHYGKFKEILLRHVKRSAEMEDVPGSPKKIEKHVALT